MNRRGLAQGVIDALPEPAFLLAPDGAIVGANRAARGMLGPQAGSGNIAELVLMPAEEVRRYLAQSRCTTSPVPGALVFRAGTGRRLRVGCARLSGQAADVLLMLRCTGAREDRFAVLAERIRHLDSELRRRVREKEVLRQALDEKRNLTRELQHRVKNNIQMMISLLGMSAASGASPEVGAFAAGVRERFRALATTQDLIYESQAASVVSAGDLLERLGRALADSAGGAVTISTEAADISLPQESVHCLALIVNELVTNSIKHGLDGGGRVRISLGRQGGQLRLVVQDDGKGYPPLDTLHRSSGLTLIRGLCRQIGASLELDNDGGARTVIAFADPAPRFGRATGAEPRPAESPAST